MNPKPTVTVSMLWVGILVFLSQGYVGAVREWIQARAGTTPKDDNESSDSPSTEGETTTEQPWWETTKQQEINSYGG